MRWRRAVLFALVSAVVLAGASSGAPTPEHVHFTAAGDYASSTGTTAGVLNALATNGSDIHLALGDLSYATTGQEDVWCDFVKARLGEKFPFELVSGNHESNGLNGNINDFSACLPNQVPGLVGTYGRQYYVDVPQQNPLVRFIMLSPNLDFPNGTATYSAGSARYNWVSNAIDDARTSSIPWVVAGMHKPCISMGIYSCDTGADLMNLLLGKKVDLVLNGHEHMYQRSKQLALGPGCTSLTIGTFNSSCVVDSDSDLVKGAGTVFATIGTGGTPLRDVNLSDPESPYFVTASGANQNGTYGFGDFDVTPDSLLMHFVRGAGASFTDAFTITRDANPPVNQKPTAAFTSTSDGLTASLDASTSSDPEGPIATYAWEFGDGSVGSGVKPSHPYATAGSYPVKLTVTDPQGATDSVTQNVVVTDPPTGTVLASDEFERIATSSWGRADVGGNWTLRGVTSRFSVGGGAGRLQIPSGATLSSDLTSVSSQNSRTTAEFSVDKLTSNTYVLVVGRQIGSDYYAARLIAQNGVGRLYLMGGGAAIGVNTSTFTFTAGDHYRILLEVKGKSPTTVRAKIWKTTDPEPAAWQRSTTDSFAALQAPGRVGVVGYLSSSATNGPVTVSFHQFAATDAN